MFAARGVILDADACRVLYGLAVRGLTVLRDRDGMGQVPASTAALVQTLAREARGTAEPPALGTGTPAAGPVPGAGSTRDQDYTVSEAATAWGCTTSYVRRLARLGVVPATKDDAGGWRLPADYVRDQDGPPRAGNGAQNDDQ